MAVAALHADQPTAGSHVCEPKHVPIVLTLVHARLAPFMPAVHVQLPVVGWQYEPACVPCGSATQL